MYNILYAIYFCYIEKTDAYGELSNFARYHIITHNVIWHTSEHDFQTMKFSTL